jgi:hypothetical protein
MIFQLFMSGALRQGKYALLALSTLLVTSIPSARAFTVFDPSNFFANIQQYYQFIEQLRATYQQLDTMYHQLMYAQRQFEAMQHPNYWKQFITRRPDWLPRDWRHTQNMLNQGYNPGDAGDVNAYESAVLEHGQTFPKVETRLLAGDPNSRRVKQYQLEDDAAAKAAGASKAAYASLAGDAERGVRGYREQIDDFARQIAAIADGDTDIKDVLDAQAAMQVLQMQMQADTLALVQHQLQLQYAQANRSLTSTAQSATFFGTSPLEHAKK